MNWVGHEIGGKYRIERVLGEGGMGIVYLARHVELGHPVAIKALKRAIADDPEARGRFEREARAAASLTSEHVAHVTDVGRMPDDTPYMVMEYLEGEDLAARIEREGALAPNFAIECILQACDGLDEAHQKGIVHRDVKPANLFLVRKTNGRVMVKVLDFGIAKAAAFGRGELTQTSNVLGSPLYMSPEQLRASKDVDARSDVWSVGVTLFFLLTKRVPFEAEGIGEIAAKILYAEPVPLRLFVPDLPEGLEATILACLRKAPAERIGSVGELVGRLAEFRTSAASGGRFVTSPTLSMREAAEARAAVGKSGPIETLPLDVRRASGTLSLERRSATETAIMERPEPPSSHERGGSTILMGAPPVHASDPAPGAASPTDDAPDPREVEPLATPTPKRRGGLAAAAVVAVLGLAIGARGLWAPAPTPPAPSNDEPRPAAQPAAVPAPEARDLEAPSAATGAPFGASSTLPPPAPSPPPRAPIPPMAGREGAAPSAPAPLAPAAPARSSAAVTPIAAALPVAPPPAAPPAAPPPAAPPPAPAPPAKKPGSVLDMELQ